MKLRAEDLGEFGLIDRIISVLGGPKPPYGMGDDCALVELGNEGIAVTTDMIAESTDVPPGMKPWEIGWYAVAINISDLASKGAKPLAFFSSIAIPPETPVSLIEGIYHGMKDCCSTYDCYVAGGDTSRGGELMISGTAIGRVNASDFIQRSGAMVGDVIALTGELGLPALGLEILFGKSEYKCDRAVRALLIPRPRVREGVYLAEKHLCTASMDTSDGLASSLHQLARASGTGMEIDLDLLPIAPEVMEHGGEDLERLALYTGGEFELLLTMKEENFEEARKTIDMKSIGTVTDSGVRMRKSGRITELRDTGYSHF
jgi:thiamine-monophosphate kinase